MRVWNIHILHVNLLFPRPLEETEKTQNVHRPQVKNHLLITSLSPSELVMRAEQE